MSVEYKIHPIGQHNSQVCWIACYRMLNAWKKQADKLCYDRLKASKIPMDQALNITQWPKARNAMKLTSHTVSYLKQDDNLGYTLEKYGPMWCAGNFLNGSGHVILLSGYYPKNNTIRVIDPWKVHKGIKSEVWGMDWWRTNIKDAHAACQTWY